MIRRIISNQLQCNGCGCCGDYIALEQRYAPEIKKEIKDTIDLVKEVCKKMGWDFEEVLEEVKE